MQAKESKCSRCRNKFMFYPDISSYNLCDECIRILYFSLRGSLDHEHSDSTIIVSLTGDFYTTIGNKEFKL